MSNNTVKFVFLFVIIGVVLFSRTTYPNFSVTPSLSANEAQSLASKDPSLVVLPTASTSNATISAGGATPTQPVVRSSTVSSTLTYAVGGSTPQFSKAGSTTPPSLAATAVLVADLSGGDALLATNADARWPMASLTKLMTAAIATDNLKAEQTIMITSEMFAVDPQEYTLQIGGIYTVADLLRVLLLPSSNVAAEALAEAYGRAQFVAAMNAKAQTWGMASTYYDDPSGLSSANQSTAHDLLLLTKQMAQTYPQIFSITRNQQVNITEISSNKKVVVKSINNFSGTANFLGGKTGHTNEANGNLLSLFAYNSRPVFILVLGTDDGFGDTQKLYSWVKANYK